MTFEPSRLVSYDGDAVLAEIRRVLGQFFGDRCPSRAEFDSFSRVSSSTVVKQFGSWAAAMGAVGIEYVRKKPTKPRIDTADLVADLKRILRMAGGRYFSTDFYLKNGGQYHPETIRRRFGNLRWAELCEKTLGVRPVRKVMVVVKKTSRCPPSRDELLQELRRVWNEFGRRPTYGEFKSRSAIGMAVFERTFGSWKRAIMELASQDGSVVSWAKGTHCTRELLPSEMRSVAAKNIGSAFLYANYRDLGGTYSIGTFQKHFGSWRNAASAIGCKYGRSPAFQTFSDEQFFAEIQRVWELLGRQPTLGEMKAQGSKMSCKTFQRRFGSWMRAIHAFCEDRNIAEANTAEAPQADESIAIKPSRAAKVEPSIVVIEKCTPRQPSLRLRFRVFQRDRFSCQACGRSPATEPGVVLHVDHIIPYSGLGETVLENLQTLCNHCNLGKSDLILPLP